ncbi:UNVERIFIED_CONTAM: hypothetical protein HDU68_000731 [Siphonaria sp. JEL0065]|nr:hypothetical protein HDU68_000731 [Siphonaria sp. JEL0065]
MSVLFLVNLTAQFGLYTGLIGCLVYSLLPHQKTSLSVPLVGQTFTQYVPKATTAQAVTFAITLSFCTGLIQVFIIGLFRLRVVVDFFPVPILVSPCLKN